MLKQSKELNKINTKTGIMENETILGYVINKLNEHVLSGGKLNVGIIHKSKNHNGKPMILINDYEEDDINIYNIEISEDGVFAYIVDDGVS